MNNLPKNGDKVRIWPFPGRRAQINERAVNHEQGGRFADACGHDIVWSDYHFEAYRAGDFLLHPPLASEMPEPQLEEIPAEAAPPAPPEAAPEQSPAKTKRSKEQG